MSNLRCNNRGFTLVEVVIAMFLTVVAVLALFSLQPTAWRTATRSDYLGRASGILYETLMTQEALIMNPCNAVAAVAGGPTVVTTGPTAVFASGQATAQPGDAQFNVTTTIAIVAANVWRVTVLVTWAGHAGISESLVVTRQEGFRFPAGCANQ